MGMFDEVICRYPLPGTKPEFVEDGHLFQTKDLDCDMSLYEITEDGRLIGRDNYTGELDFYSGNVVGGGSGFQFTANGEDAEWVNYLALFVEGRITNITQVSYQRAIALASSEWEWRERERGAPEYSLPTPLLGCRVFVLWGGGTVETDGYHAKCVAETEHDVCLQADDGKLETIDKRLLARIVHPDRESAKALEDWENAAELAVRTRMQAKLDAKAAARVTVPQTLDTENRE